MSGQPRQEDVTETAVAGDHHYLVVLVTAPNTEEAEKIAEVLVQERLAACITVLPNATSVYRWEGKLHKDQEVLLIVKTRAALFSALTARVQQLHSYQVPEIIALPVVAGAPSYLQWLAAETGRDEDRS